MEDLLTRATAALRQRDLRMTADVAMMRLPQHSAEWHRLQRMRALLDAEAELGRRLASHTHCLLVNCGGSLGSGDLNGEAEALFSALQDYTATVREIAAEYDELARTNAPASDRSDGEHVDGEPVSAVPSGGGLATGIPA